MTMSTKIKLKWDHTNYDLTDEQLDAVHKVIAMLLPDNMDEQLSEHNVEALIELNEVGLFSDDRMPRYVVPTNKFSDVILTAAEEKQLLDELLTSGKLRVGGEYDADRWAFAIQDLADDKEWVEHGCGVSDVNLRRMRDLFKKAKISVEFKD